MANITLQTAKPAAVAGVAIQPMTTYEWDVKNDSGASAGVVSDVIYTPTFDLTSISPHCNRVVFERQSTVAATDTQKIQISPDGTNWYTAPLFNGGTGGGTAIANTSLNECALVGLPAMRFIRGAITLATAMSGQTAYRAALSFMRF